MPEHSPGKARTHDFGRIYCLTTVHPAAHFVVGGDIWRMAKLFIEGCWPREKVLIWPFNLTNKPFLKKKILTFFFVGGGAKKVLQLQN
jgi:hypothetical protein